MPASAPGRHRAPRRPITTLALRGSVALIASGGLIATMSPAAQATGVAAQPTSTVVAQPQASVLPAAPASWTTVRYGARGGMVATIQRIVGSYPDGVFGPKTLAAVKSWQARHGLVPDGIVGPLTSAAMKLAPARTAPAAASRSATRTVTGASVLAVAQQYTGIMYRWGGATPAGFDCSGFVQYVYGKLGINLPRGTEAQRRATTPVSNPRPGDLVFWGSPAYHTAIYAGDGMIYDSGRPGLPTQKRKMFSGVTGFGRVG